MCLNGYPPAVALSGTLAEVSLATESASLSVGFEMTALPLFLLLDCRSVVRLLFGQLPCLPLWNGRPDETLSPVSCVCQGILSQHQKSEEDIQVVH